MPYPDGSFLGWLISRTSFNGNGRFYIIQNFLIDLLIIDPKFREKYLRIHIDEKISRDDITLLEIETERINSTQGEDGVAWEGESCLWFAYDAYGYGYTFHVNQIREVDGTLMNSTVLPGKESFLEIQQRVHEDLS